MWYAFILATVSLFSSQHHLKLALTQSKFSVIDVIETMLSVQSSIHVHKKTKDKYKLPGSMSYEASALYRAFGVKRELDASIYQN